MSAALDKMTIVGDHEPKVIAQLKRCVDDAAGVRGVLCADGHYGYSMPVGGVVAYADAVSPSGVGYDIACGNKAVRTPLKATDVLPDLAGIMDRIVREIAFGIGRKAAVPVDDSLFADPTWTDVRALGSLKGLAQSQLGTVGSGNHYVDLFADENDDLWVGVHFGSRGFGHRTASGFLNVAAGRGFGDKAPGEMMDQPPTMLSLASPLGSDYFAAMQLAGRYAYAGRDAVVNKVLGILGTSAVEEIHNHHNFCVYGDAIIPTTSGPKRMADLRAGDTIYAFDEEAGPVETRVLSQWSSGRKPIYHIETQGHSLRVSGDHPILVIEVEVRKSWRRKRFGHYVWKRTSELQVGDIVVGVRGYYPKDGRDITEDQGRLMGGNRSGGVVW